MRARALARPLLPLASDHAGVMLQLQPAPETITNKCRFRIVKEQQVALRLFGRTGAASYF